ncbi:MAG TPA: hypothetical protein PKD54_16355, partial [Pirellulaceae bacterium]|nr:hypothetical protein [Pirellulaceae bacterium]
MNSSNFYTAFSAGDQGFVRVSDFGSQLNANILFVGLGGNGQLELQQGGKVNSIYSELGSQSGSVGTVTLSDGSSWENSDELIIGRFGTGTLNIHSFSSVVTGTTTIGAQGNVNLLGGLFNFGVMKADMMARVNPISGSLTGVAVNDVSLDVATLNGLKNPHVNSDNVTLINNGTLFGHANLGGKLVNSASGEVEIGVGQRIRFGGSAHSNAGEINNFGGIIRFDGSLTNHSTGFVAGRGQFIANGGWTNSGVMAFSGGYSDVLGDVEIMSGGRIITSGFGLTTFYDDVIHNGAEIRTSAQSASVFLGEVTGAGSFTGTGTVFFEGDLRPGNSPGVVSFGGDVVLGSTSRLLVELGGLGLGEFDQLQIVGGLSLGGGEL